MKPWLLLSVLVCIGVSACEKVTVTRPVEEEAAAGQEAANGERVKELEREIEKSTNIIADLEAAVLMERDKVADDPDYDQSFLRETLGEQDHEREKIERARQEIEALTGSGK